MASDRGTPDDLHAFSQDLVRKLVRRHHIAGNEHRKEDAIRDFYCGRVYQVWREIGELVRQSDHALHLPDFLQAHRREGRVAGGSIPREPRRRD